MMVMFISEADISQAPMMTTMLLTSIGAATAAIGSAIRAILWHRKSHHKKIIPLLCAVLALIYIFISCKYSHLNDVWLVFGLFTMIVLNFVLIIDMLHSSGGKKNAE